MYEWEAVIFFITNCFFLLQTGRQGNYVQIKHSGSQLMDLKWNPFNDRVLATSADDGTVRNKPLPECE